MIDYFARLLTQPMGAWSLLDGLALAGLVLVLAACLTAAKWFGEGFIRAYRLSSNDPEVAELLRQWKQRKDK